MSENDLPDVPGLPDVGGPIPKPYEDLIDGIGSAAPESRKAAQYDARLHIWLVFTEMRARQLLARESRAHAKSLADLALAQSRTSAESADRHAKALTDATKRLMYATVVLAGATVGLVLITAFTRGSL